MLNYLCDVKSRLRSQDQAVDVLKHQEGEIKERVQCLEDLTTKLSAELANTKEELAKCQREKKEEKDASLVIEMKLREHLQKTQDAYQQLAQ
jgi:chromosome segregation ATPase